VPERRHVVACATSPGERVVFGLSSLVVGAAAVSMAENLLCAIPAGICATFLAIGALTGWCPTNLLQLGARRRGGGGANTLGYPESLQKIDSRS